jgi:hypothetical protein
MAVTMKHEPAYIASSLFDNLEDRQAAKFVPPATQSADRAETDSTMDAGSEAEDDGAVDISGFGACCETYGASPFGAADLYSALEMAAPDWGWNYWHPGYPAAFGANTPAWPSSMYPHNMPPLGDFDGAASAWLPTIGGETGQSMDWMMMCAPSDEGDAAALAAGIDVGSLDRSPPTSPPSHLPDNMPEPSSVGGASLLGEVSFDDSFSQELAAPPGLQPPGLTRGVSTPHASASVCSPPPTLARAVSMPARPIHPQPPTISKSRSADGSCLRIFWTVDAKKLKVKDKVAVSPPFELDEKVPGTFRMMLYPKIVSDRKGGASFKKAKGKGSVHIKCESPEGEVHDGVVALRIWVASNAEESDECGTAVAPVRHVQKSAEQEDDTAEDEDEANDQPRGPVLHNFAEGGICGLPKDEEEWNFGKATDELTQRFVVRLEIFDPKLEGTQ